MTELRLPERSRIVRDALRSAGLTSEIQVLPDPARTATPEQVRAATGQAIGGVAPVGHPEPLQTIIDISLADYDPLWVAGGTPHTILPLSYRELIKITAGREEPVGD